MGRPEGPTPFIELNNVLADLVARARGILLDNFVGAYLQGSFALGEGDMQSDCDFLIVTAGPITSEQERELRALHDEIPTREGHWTHHLEGSYAPMDELRSLRAIRREWLYIDHGWRQMQWATHCNSEVVRWIMREHGIALAGPPARTLVDEVSPARLRARMKRNIETLIPDVLTWISFDIAWAQRYAATTICRTLYTIEHGAVASKRVSLVWARDALDPGWRDLLTQTLEDRARGFDGNDPPRPGLVERTYDLWEYAKEWARIRPIIREHDLHLSGERVVLRPMRDTDLPLLFEWNQDADVLHYADGSDVEAHSLEMIEGIYGGVSEHAFCFMIDLDGRAIGECWLQEMNLARIARAHPGRDCRRIDIMVGAKELWGKGHGTDAIRALVRFGFEHQRADLIFGCDIARDNARSAAAFRKAGFTDHAGASTGEQANSIDVVIARVDAME